MAAGPKAGAVSCSICLEIVSCDANERSIAKLVCGHQFHLDCIGSAFNAKGYMQCPNCRRTENGQWLYASGDRYHRDDFSFETEEEFDVYAGVSDLLFSHDLTHFGLLEWCPYQDSYAHLSYSLRNAEQQLPTAHADLVFDVVVGENMQRVDSVHPCPFVVGQGLNPSRSVLPIEGNAGVQDTTVHSRNGALRPQLSASTTSPSTTAPRQCAHQPSAMVAPVGVVGSVALEERSRWPQPVRNAYPSQTRHHGWLPNAAQPQASQIAAPYPATPQFPHRPTGGWGYAGTSAAQSMPREVEPMNNHSAGFTQRMQEGVVSAFRQYPTGEGQRWAPPPLSGLYGAHGILGSGLPMQASFGAPDMQFSNQYDSSFPGFHLYDMAEDDIPHCSSPFETRR